jgi:MFS family permease
MALNGIAANTMLQTQAPDRLRGRVMGFYSFVVLGMAPFGSLEAGWLAEHYGVRTAVASGGLVCLVVAWGVAWRMWRTVGRKDEGPHGGTGDRTTAGRLEAGADGRSSQVLGGRQAASEDAGQTATEWSEEDGVGPSLRSG